MRVRVVPAALIPALALAVVLSSCGTSTSAVPDPSSLPSSVSSSTAPSTTGSPSITVPGLSSSAPSSSASSSRAPSKTPVSSSASSSAAAPPSTRTSRTTTPVPATTSAQPTPPAETTPAPTTEPPAEPTPTTPDPTTEPPAEPTTEPTTEPPAEPTSTPKPPTTPAPQTTPGGGGSMTKKIVVIDAGHNGQNFAHPEIINKQVDAGFGQRKPCNTTGTETNAGYTEALFNWKVSLALKSALEAKGITVIMTRDSNDGVGPCVNDRAAIGNNSQAAAVISIHGDGDDASANGFYVMTAEQDPAGAATAAQSARLADDVRDGLVNTGFSPSNHLGSDGLWKRGDLAGLNLSQKPTVMLEMGNMRNSGDAETMSSASGQQRYAEGIAAGVVQYIIGR